MCYNKPHRSNAFINPDHKVEQNQPQSVILYNSRFDYEFQNNPEYQETWAVFMFWVLVAAVVYCGYHWVKAKISHRRLRKTNHNKWASQEFRNRNSRKW